MPDIHILSGLVWYASGDSWQCGVMVAWAFGPQARFTIASSPTSRGRVRLYDNANQGASEHTTREQAAAVAAAKLAAESATLYAK
jgi:hypothetical protein